MKVLRPVLPLLVVTALVFFFLVPASAQAPTIEGTYKLVSRKLADGRVISPPESIGLWTYSKTHRTFNIIRRDAAGKVTSRSLVSSYTLTPAEYTETLLFHIRTDQIGGKDAVYEVEPKCGSVPGTVEGGRIRFKLPFEGQIPVVFGGNRITVNAAGGVDVWDRVP